MLFFTHGPCFYQYIGQYEDIFTHLRQEMNIWDQLFGQGLITNLQLDPVYRLLHHPVKLFDVEGTNPLPATPPIFSLDYKYLCCVKPTTRR